MTLVFIAEKFDCLHRVFQIALRGREIPPVGLGKLGILLRELESGVGNFTRNDFNYLTHFRC